MTYIESKKISTNYLIKKPLQITGMVYLLSWFPKYKILYFLVSFSSFEFVFSAARGAIADQVLTFGLKTFQIQQIKVRHDYSWSENHRVFILLVVYPL